MLTLTESGYFVSERFFSEHMTPKRTVQYYELELFETGTGFCFINGIKYRHTKNLILFAKPGAERFTIGKFECQYVKFSCSDEEAAALLNQMPDAVTVQDCLQLKSLLKTFISQQQPHTAAPLFRQTAALFTLLAEAAELFTESGGEQEKDYYFPNIITSKEFMDCNFGCRISLDMLSKNAHMSKNFFRVKFCETIGISPHAYLSNVRLAHAETLLTTTMIPLAEIAVVCGYESQSYMNYVFKKELGITPLKLRRHKTETAVPPGK